MTDMISYDTDAIKALATGVRTSQTRLDEIDDSQPWKDELTSETRDAHHDFKQRWDDRRDQLSDGLRSVADALQVIADSFEETDQANVDALNGESTGGEEGGG